MTLEGARKNLCPFYAKIDPAILDGGNSGPGNSGEIGELALAQFLALPAWMSNKEQNVFKNRVPLSREARN